MNANDKDDYEMWLQHQEPDLLFRGFVGHLHELHLQGLLGLEHLSNDAYDQYVLGEFELACQE